MKKTDTYRSPLRYPGGKQRDIPFLSKFFPETCQEFREPFLGGGSGLLYALQNSLADSYWGNDLNSALIDFWQQTQQDINSLISLVLDFQGQYKGKNKNCPEWQKFRREFLLKLNTLSGNQLRRAAKFFILNRSTSGGSTESGGMTPAAYCDRFTVSSIKTLERLRNILIDVKFTSLDYEELLKAPGKDVFIFLDPPYFSARLSGLYGRAGDLHRGFDHQRLAKTLYHCQHKWLMTIDNSDEIRKLYCWAETLEWSKFYGMTNFGGRKSKLGFELLVANFPLNKDTKFIYEFASKEIDLVNPNELKIHPLYKELNYHEPEKYLDDLVSSFKEWGFYKKNAILVSPKMEIIVGYRRREAALKVGLDLVPIRKLSAKDYELKQCVLDTNKDKINQNFKLEKNVSNYWRARQYEILRIIELKKMEEEQTNGNSSSKNIQLSINYHHISKRPSDTRDIIGRKVGWSGRTADKALRALRFIDLFQNSENKEDRDLAVEVKKRLNQNPNSAYILVNEIIKTRADMQEKMKLQRFKPKSKSKKN